MSVGFFHKEYPKDPCDNPVCDKCFYQNRDYWKWCEYYLKTGKHKTGTGETCDSFKAKEVTHGE